MDENTDQVSINSFPHIEETASYGTNENESTIMVEDPHGMGGSNLGTNAALMNLIKCNIGIGILAMPSVANYCGVFIGPILILVVGYISTYMSLVLIRCSNTLVTKFGMDRSKMDYTETVFGVFKFGPERLRKYKGKIKHFTNGVMIVAQIGFCCAYLLFMGQNIQFFINEYFGHCYDLPIVSAFVMLLVLCLCWIKNLNIIARVAIAANFCAILGVILILVFCLMDLQDWRKFRLTTKFNDFLIGFGIAVFAFEAINIVLPIQNKMKYPERYVTPAGVVNTAMVFVVCLYTGMSFYGFLRFGTNIKGSITLNLPRTPLWLSPIKPLFVFSILTSYLLQLYIPVVIFGKLMNKLRCHRDACTLRQKVHLKLIPPIIVIFSYAVSVCIPHLDLMLSLLGAVSSSYLALILPPVVNVIAKFSDLDRPHNYLFCLSIFSDLLIFLFGMVSFIGGTASSVMALVTVMADPNSKQTPCLP